MRKLLPAIFVGIMAVLCLSIAGAIARQQNHEVELQDQDTVDVWCHTGILEMVAVDESWQQGHCEAYTRTPTVTATSTATPTATRTPTHTSQPTPISTIVGSVPLCTHDKTKWHPLYDAVRGCHYTHEHHDDPNSINDLFGPPGGWFGQPGLEMDIPWHAVGGSGNPEGHEGYKWAVRRYDQPLCLPTPADYQGCFVAARVLVHVNAAAGAATVRFHGMSMETIVEKDGVRGMMRWGGWLDTGHLALAHGPGNVADHICPPLANNPTTFRCGYGRFRRHSSINLPTGYQPHTAHTATWYGNHALGGVAPSFDEFGPINYHEPAMQHYFPNSPHANGSTMKLTGMSANTMRPWLMAHKNAQNVIVHYRGYLDRHGEPVTGCTVVGRDCVPVQIDGVKWGVHEIPNVHDVFREYDTSPAASKTGTEWWITVPN